MYKNVLKKRIKTVRTRSQERSAPWSSVVPLWSPQRCQPRLGRKIEGFPVKNRRLHSEISLETIRKISNKSLQGIYIYICIYIYVYLFKKSSIFTRFVISNNHKESKKSITNLGEYMWICFPPQRWLKRHPWEPEPIKRSSPMHLVMCKAGNAGPLKMYYFPHVAGLSHVLLMLFPQQAPPKNHSFTMVVRMGLHSGKRT